MALGTELEADARAILERHSLTCDRIVAIDRDSILYLNRLGKARTCWLDVAHDGRVRIDMVPGFQAEPPDGWHARGIPNFGRSGGEL